MSNYKIEKKGENHVIVIPIKTVKDINGNDVQYYDESETEEYGQHRIDHEKQSAQDEKTKLTNDWLQKEQDRVNDKLKHIDNIQEVMNNA